MHPLRNKGKTSISDSITEVLISKKDINGLSLVTWPGKKESITLTITKNRHYLSELSRFYDAQYG